MPIIP
ncbi:UNVERIFIED_CONTAM: hypothetical protein GTU68_055659 [Idotea baltica]